MIDLLLTSVYFYFFFSFTYFMGKAYLRCTGPESHAGTFA